MKALSKISVWILLASLISCSLVDDIDKLEDPEWNPELAIPLATATFDVDDFVSEFSEESYLIVDSTGLLRFKYQSELYRTTGEELFEIPDLIIPLVDTANSVALPSNEITGYSLSEGTLVYELLVNTADTLDISFSLPNASLNGQTLRQSLMTSGPGIYRDSISLASYRFDFTDQLVEAYYTSTSRSTQEHHEIPGILLRVKDQKYRYVEGLLQDVFIPLPADTVEFELYKAAESDPVNFAEASINFDVYNSFGVPTKLFVDQLEAETFNSGSFSVESDLFDEGIFINYPGFDEAGTLKYTRIVIDQDNSNMTQLIAANPYKVVYDLSTKTEPDSLEGGTGFITDQSELIINMDIDVPLFGSISFYRLSDTLDINLEDVDELGESAALRMVVDNGFPLDIWFQAYLLDESGGLLDSLFDEPIQFLNAASVNAEGRVTALEKTTQDINLDERRLDALLQSNQLILEGSLATYDHQNTAVKLFNDYLINMKLGLILGL